MYSLLNICGLALAVAASLLMGLFIYHEWNYDRQSPHASSIWRAYNETINDGKVVTRDANTHAILGPSLKADLPEIIEFTRLYNHGQKEVNVLYKKIPYKLSNPWMVDNGFLRMFPQQFLNGDPATCLNDPYSVVITGSTATRLFGARNAVGQFLEIPGGWFAGIFKVTAVVADPPPNTHLKFNLLASYKTRYAQGHADSWDNYWDYNYFQLAPHADVEKVKKQLGIYSLKYLKKEGIQLSMQPLTDIHLHSNLTYEIEANSDEGTIRALAIVALFILAIAFINYINLTTARSLIRMKEVGVRKVLGANRLQLAGQFLTEGALVTLLAITLALALLWLTLPWFQQFLGTPLVNYRGFQKTFWLLVPGIWLLALLSACLYPAIVLSSFSPLATLKNNIKKFSGKNDIRRGLVVFQFTCSIVLLTSLFVVGGQLSFLRNQDKGLSLDKVLALKIPELNWQQDSANQQRVGVLREKIAGFAAVKSLTTSSVVPGQGVATISGTSGGLFPIENPAIVTPATIYFYNTEPSFFSTYSIGFLAGAPYEAVTTNREASRHIVINELARRMFGFANAHAAVGQEVAYQSNPGYRMKIHAVVSDFHIESAKEPVRPTLYFCSPPLTNGYISVKADAADMQNLLHNLEQAWKSVFPESVFDYTFVDEQFNEQYKAEDRLALIISGFTLFAIFIACLGLFGLSALAITQRIKEIGIRKVLGASVEHIVGLLSKDFIKLFIIAAVIAFPIAWYTLNKWLENYAYRIEIRWWAFAIPALLATITGLATISIQAVKAALSDPVNSLRNE